MGLDYALVHAKFTIPLAVLLTVAGKPFLTRLDAVRIAFLVTIAVVATIPWDSYLIRTGVWTYPDDGILGPTAFSIPIEELFFFVIQTYIASMLYIICNKPVLLAQYLDTPETRPAWVQRGKMLGLTVLVSATAYGGYLIQQQGEGTYLGLILAWACPFLIITWGLTGEMLLVMPWTSTALPILAPTLYLWVVDELSLRQGIWTIETGTKLNSQLFGSLDVEEAVFFLMTNMLVCFGIAAFDKAVAVCDAHPDLFRQPADALPVTSLLRARFLPYSMYDMEHINGIKEAVVRLRSKSRSFYLASSVFPGRMRIDLTLLYSYCRLADDLIDEAESPKEALACITRLKSHLDSIYCGPKAANVRDFLRASFPPSALSALDQLPSSMLSPGPLYELLEGFKTDVQFHTARTSPIHDEDDLERYATRVASTVGSLCLDIVFHHTAQRITKRERAQLYASAREMGVALQYVNIARDVAVDAGMGRVYLPATWLAEEGITGDMVLADPHGPGVDRMRRRLLGKAFERYRASRPSMEGIPREARAPMIVAVESYMEIGRVLGEGGLRVEGKATVPAWRRMKVVWKTLVRS